MNLKLIKPGLLAPALAVLGRFGKPLTVEVDGEVAFATTPFTLDSAKRTYYLTLDGKVTTHRGSAQVKAKTRARNVAEARSQFAA